MSVLYILATPIGNLSDISLRALEVLKSVDWIVAEDTRHTQRLLSHYGIERPLFSLHQYNERQRSEKIIDLLLEGKNIALVSDAGTPLISDPGYPLVVAAQQRGITVVPIPGACAAITALCVSGLPAAEFLFVGFLPPKGEKRVKRLQQLANEARTLVLYESVHRIVDLLERMLPIFGEERIVCLARELTKQYETIYRAPLCELLAFVQAHPEQQKGEFVLVVAGAESAVKEIDAECERVLRILLDELSLKQAVQLTQRLTGVSHRKLYEFALMVVDRGERLSN